MTNNNHKTKRSRIYSERASLLSVKLPGHYSLKFVEPLEKCGISETNATSIYRRRIFRANAAIRRKPAVIGIRLAQRPAGLKETSSKRNGASPANRERLTILAIHFRAAKEVCHSSDLSSLSSGPLRYGVPLEFEPSADDLVLAHVTHSSTSRPIKEVSVVGQFGGIRLANEL